MSVPGAEVNNQQFGQSTPPSDLVSDEEVNNQQQQIEFPPQTERDDDEIKRGNKGLYRFEVSVLTLATMMLAVCVLQTMATFSYPIMRLVAFPCGIFLAFFGYEWVIYFSDGLTRRKRAYFDVKNILETYQPRRGTDESRGFKPDPPTPNVLMPPRKGSSADYVQDDTETAENKPPMAENDFTTWRRKHYENEYNLAMETGEARLYDPPPQEQTDLQPDKTTFDNSLLENNDVHPDQTTSDDPSQEQSYVQSHYLPYHGPKEKNSQPEEKKKNDGSN